MNLTRPKSKFKLNKPCPFCGKSPIYDPVEAWLGMYYMTCSMYRCAATGPLRTTPKAAKVSWNKMRAGIR